ncbi:MAG: alpha-galactosidase [Clostridiales bacterium]|nr:alpha-galactosidase [Clostridiales bacterium]
MSRKKFAFIGSGSVVFTRNLVRDILTFPAFEDCEIALMDINPDNLELSRRAAERIVTAGNYSAVVTATTDRVEALKDADGVLITIQVGGFEASVADVAIPKEYGISMNVGDTRGPSGIFRFLRTLPVMLDILKDIERYCPDAIVLNYTNPMAMLCRAMQSVSEVNINGLCHSVQGTAEMLARWIGAPMDEITYTCAGINHQAHYLEYKWNGEDAYPLIRKAITEREEIYNEEQVRNEMFLHLGYYVTESSGHNSEYNPWFRKRPDLIEKYCTHGTGWNPGLDIMERREKLMTDEKAYENRRITEFNKWIEGEIDLNRGSEYAAYIFNAVFGDNEMFEFNGNVRNFGLIDNLPEGCCVEVPVLASKGRLRPLHVGPLPPQLAILNQINASCEELAVEGAFEGDPEKIYHACLYDPLTSAVCSMSEVREMVDRMFTAQAKWLPQFKHLK